MFYLFLQTWIWILVAGLLGLFIGWLIWGNRAESGNVDAARLKRQLDECHTRCAELEQRATSQPAAVMASNQAEADETGTDVIASAGPSAIDDDAAETVILDSWKPQALSGPEGEADDLKRVKGIGPVIEKTLNELGIYHFRQIGSFTEDNVRWVDNYIAFPGRIQRENWVSQAQQLGGGGTTEFADRYDKKP